MMEMKQIDSNLSNQQVSEWAKCPPVSGWEWIVSAWGLFKAQPGIWVGMIVVYMLIFLGLGIVPVIGSLAANLLMPVFLGGFMLGAHSLAKNGELKFEHLFAGFKEDAANLILVGLFYLLGFVLVTIVLVILGVVMFFFFAPDAQSDASSALLFLVLLVGILMMVAATIPLVMAIWFAPALVVFHKMSAMDAMVLSFKACLGNIVPFLIYGLVLLVAGIVATIPLMLGWLILSPIIILSQYTAYRDIFQIAAD